MNCQFCAELDGNDPLDRWWHQEGGWALGPTVGHFTRGYLLLVPIDHRTSFAGAASDDLVVADHHVAYARETLSRRYGPAIVAEHGSGGFCRRGAACCDHAHLHIIPLRSSLDGERVKTAYFQRDDRVVRILSLRDLARWKDRPYLYLSTRFGEHLVWPMDERNETRFPRQFVRRVCADVLGLRDWDWRAAPFLDRLRNSRDELADSFLTCVN